MPAYPRRPPLCGLALALAIATVAAAQQEPPATEEAPPPHAGPELRFGVEVKAGFRDSDENRFPVPFSDFGQPRSLTTVDPGSSLEVGNVALFADAVWGESLVGHVKVDLVDLYDRNPTSTDKKVDVD